MKKILLLTAAMTCFFSCSSSPYNYTVDPTPIVKGKTKYSVKNVTVKLKTFGIKITKDSEVKGYLSEADMAKVFKEKITDNLKKKNILDSDQSNGYTLSIDIDYKRNFAVNSNKTLHPDFSFAYSVQRDGKSVVSYASGARTFSGFALYAEILSTGSSDINPEKEMEYIERISGFIVNGYGGITEIGK